MKLALGTVQFGLDYGVSNTQGQVCFDEVKKIIAFAHENKINTLDTAAAYGESETVLGNICNQIMPPFKIITKLSPSIGDNNLEKALALSLKNLRVANVYALMLHDVEVLLSSFGENLYKQLVKLKEKNYCKKIGVSVYTPIQLIRVLEKYDIDIVQLPLNILDQRFTAPHLIDCLKQKNIEIHARSLFLQGLLLMKNNQMPVYFDQFNDVFEPLNTFCNTHSITKLEACISFAKSLSFVDKFVIGVSKLTELKQILSIYNKIKPLGFSQYASQEQHLINPSYWS